MFYDNTQGIKPYPNYDEANGNRQWNLEDKTQKIETQWHKTQIIDDSLEQISSIFISCPYPSNFFNNNPDLNVYIHNFSTLANDNTFEIELNGIRCIRGQKIIDTINFSKLGIITFSYLRRREDTENYNFEIKQFKTKTNEETIIPVWHTEGLL